jgi:hypothetical protein
MQKNGINKANLKPGQKLRFWVMSP